MSEAYMNLLASILDFPRENLSPDIWADEKLKGDVRDEILDVVFSAIDDLNLPEQSLKDLFLYGSLLSNQFNSTTDLDARIVLDPDIVKEKYEGITGDDLYDLVEQNIHNVILDEGGEHPFNATIIIEGEESELAQSPLGKSAEDPIYSVLNDEWVVDPFFRNEEFDPDEEFSEGRDEVEDVMEKLDGLFRELRTDSIDYEMISEALNEVSDKEKFKKKLDAKLEEIESGLESAVDEYEDIKQERKDSYKEYKKHNNPGNLQFKFLEKYNYLSILKEMKKILEGGLEQSEVEEVDEELEVKANNLQFANEYLKTVCAFVKEAEGEISAYERAQFYEDTSFSGAKAADFDWRFEKAYPLNVLDAYKYKSITDEVEELISEVPSYYNTMFEWWKETNKEEDPIIITEENGVLLEYWDGFHRIAMSVILGDTTIPAIVGTKKEQNKRIAQKTISQFEQELEEQSWEGVSERGLAAEDFDWQLEPSYPLRKFEGFKHYDITTSPLYGATMEADDWANWIEKEARDHPQYYEEMQTWLTSGENIEPLVILEEDEHVLEIWDGFHRVGLSFLLGIPTLPAIVGRKKEQNKKVARAAIKLLSQKDDLDLAREKGMLTVYHRTNLDAAEKIVESGEFLSKDSLGYVYFSSRPFGQSESYGDTIVTADIVPSAVEVNDEFPDGEVSLTVEPKYQKYLKNIRIESSENAAMRLLSQEVQREVQTEYPIKKFEYGERRPDNISEMPLPVGYVYHVSPYAENILEEGFIIDPTKTVLGAFGDLHSISTTNYENAIVYKEGIQLVVGIANGEINTENLIAKIGSSTIEDPALHVMREEFGNFWGEYYREQEMPTSIFPEGYLEHEERYKYEMGEFDRFVEEIKKRGKPTDEELDKANEMYEAIRRPITTFLDSNDGKEWLWNFFTNDLDFEGNLLLEESAINRRWVVLKSSAFYTDIPVIIGLEPPEHLKSRNIDDVGIVEVAIAPMEFVKHAPDAIEQQVERIERTKRFMEETVDEHPEYTPEYIEEYVREQTEAIEDPKGKFTYTPGEQEWKFYDLTDLWPVRIVAADRLKEAIEILGE